MNPTNAALPALKKAPAPYISVVIPVYNEEENLPELGERLLATLQACGRPFEIIFVDDGSSDRSWEILSDLHQHHPGQIRVIQFVRNFGQHQAIFAGFQATRGQIIVTLDADLQNLPEDIPKLVAKLEEGYDSVGGWRENRLDSWLRTLPSYVINRTMSWVTGVQLRDYGCMLRAYRRSVVDSINQCQESSSFIPALANLFAQRVAEIPVGHAERERGSAVATLEPALAVRGHRVAVADLNSGTHAIVARRAWRSDVAWLDALAPRNGWEGGADPRREGTAAGTPAPPDRGGYWAPSH